MEIPKEIVEQLKKNDEAEQQEIKEILSDATDGLDEEIEEIKKFDKTPKFDIVSKVAYLLGLCREKYENSGYLMDVYENLSSNKNAKIIRYLCFLRNQSLLNSKKIFDLTKNHNKAIYSINDVYPDKVFAFLSAEGIRFSDRANHSFEQFELEINKYIQERIGNITNLFEWIDHSFIRDLFIMPNGTEYYGFKKEAEKWQENKTKYPHSLYVNMDTKQNGFLLKNDMTFCWMLYNMNGKKFRDVNKATDASVGTKQAFYDFIDSHNKILLVVDCENTDVYRLMATFISLGEEYLSKVYKIMLVDDPNTTEVWKTLSNYISIPIEYEEVDRVLENKSLVDGTIMMNIQREYDKENIDAVIIASSDSDFYVVKKKISDLGIFVMTQYTQTSQEYLQKLVVNGIDNCHIDDFYSRNSDFIIEEAFTNELTSRMNEAVSININKLLEEVLFKIHATLNEQEKKNYISRFIRNMKFEIDENEILKVKV